MNVGGVSNLLNLIQRASITCNLLDTDQADEVKTNALEILVNVSRLESFAMAKSFDKKSISNFCLFCTSENILIRRYTSLVFGNIAQCEGCREEIYRQGGIEALVLLLEVSDCQLQSCTLWALSNLMWFAPNQERAGRYITFLFDFTKAAAVQVRNNAFLLLANLLYYSDTNCDRFLLIDQSLELLLLCIEEKDVDIVVMRCCLRSLLALSCFDNASLFIGSFSIPVLLKCAIPAGSFLETSLISLNILSNLSIHDQNRRIIISQRGFEVLIGLFIHDNVDISSLANQIVDRLKDIAPLEMIPKMMTKDRMRILMTMAKDDGHHIQLC